MKRLLAAMTAALMLVSLGSSAALAAKPTPAQTFTTTLNVNQQPAAGSYNGGFFVPTTGIAGPLFVQVDINQAFATPPLAEGLYPFYLKAGTGQKAALTAYFDAKFGPDSATYVPAYWAQITAEIAGTAPFFYLHRLAEEGAYALVDGFSHWLDSNSTSPVLVDNDYPVGTYLYVTGPDGLNGLNVQVKMKVYRV